MLIIGCDFHTRYQQVARVDKATGESTERRYGIEDSDVIEALALTAQRYCSPYLLGGGSHTND